MELLGAIAVQLFTLLFGAPLIQGMIKKTKAILQNRYGPRILQPYYDIAKYLKKDAVISCHSSWLTRATPYIVIVSLLVAGLCIPTFFIQSPLEQLGDMLLVIYLFMLARFFTALSALDAGGSFGGMGSSREMALAAIAEPALLLAVLVMLIGGGSTKLGQAVAAVAGNQWSALDPAYLVGGLAMLIVVITETGRIPVDNPDTHLELTMIHEGMLLEYSGRYLGLMVWAAQIKQMLVMSIFVNLFFPWGIAVFGQGNLLAACMFYLFKLMILGMVLAGIETAHAKMRFFQVPKLLASSIGLSIAAIIIRYAG